MREQKSIREMTDREFRTYKRNQRRLRRQRILRRRMLTVLMTVCLVAVCVFSYHSLRTSANTGAEEMRFKYYTGVIVKSGDTVWSIADQYIDYDQYKDKKEYIKEVCSINRLDDDCSIRAGQRLIVPYYSSEFIK